MWNKKKNRYELWSGSFTGVILSIDKKDNGFSFYWAIYHTEYLHSKTDRKAPNVNDMMLASSKFEISLRDAKKAVQERILEYKITDGVGKAKYQ